MSRGTVPVIGVLLLVGVTVLAAATLGAIVVTEPPEPPPTASFSVSADADTGRISLTHQGGDPINLEGTELQIEIDGESLDAQPPIPFFAAEGFESGPTGPFNAASQNMWRSGETGTITIATTNDPSLQANSTVTVKILSKGTEIAELETGA